MISHISYKHITDAFGEKFDNKFMHVEPSLYLDAMIMKILVKLEGLREVVSSGNEI